MQYSNGTDEAPLIDYSGGKGGFTAEKNFDNFMSAQHVRFSLTSALGNNKSPRLYWAACVIFVTPIVLCQFALRRHDLNILSSIVLCWGRNHFQSVSTKHLSMIRGTHLELQMVSAKLNLRSIWTFFSRIFSPRWLK